MAGYYRLKFTPEGLRNHPLLKELIERSLNYNNFNHREALRDFNRSGVNFDSLALNRLPEGMVAEKLQENIKNSALFDYISHAGGQYASIQLFIFVHQHFKLSLAGGQQAEFHKMPLHRACWQKEDDNKFTFLISQEYGLAMVPGGTSNITMHGMKMDADSLSALSEQDIVRFFLKMQEEGISLEEKRQNIDPCLLISSYEALLTVQAKITLEYNSGTQKVQPSIEHLSIYLKADDMLLSSKLFNFDSAAEDVWIHVDDILSLEQKAFQATKVCKETFKIEDEHWESQLFDDGEISPKVTSTVSQPEQNSGLYFSWYQYILNRLSFKSEEKQFPSLNDDQSKKDSLKNC